MSDPSGKTQWQCPQCGTLTDKKNTRCPHCGLDLVINGIPIFGEEGEILTAKQRRALEKQQQTAAKQADKEAKAQAAALEKQAKAAQKEMKSSSKKNKKWLPVLLAACVVAALCLFLLPGLLGGEDGSENDGTSEGYLRQPQEETENSGRESTEVDGHGSTEVDETLTESAPMQETPTQETEAETQMESETPPEIPQETELEAEPESQPLQQEAWVKNVLRQDKPHDGRAVFIPEDPVFDSQYPRQEILAVVFTDTLAQKNETAWDVSEAGDGSVMAWVESSGSGYTLYIGGEGGVNAAGIACNSLFENYINVESITFGDAFHVDMAMGMSDMFMSCKKLTELEVSHWNTSNVEYMSATFKDCRKLKHLDVSQWDTSCVTNMGSMFAGCKSLTSLDLSQWDTSRARYMDFMFYNCTKLADLNISGFDTSQVVLLYYMFCGCTSLTSVDVSSFQTSRVTYIDAMFEDCHKLQSLDLRGFDMSKVISASRMFMNCSGLRDLGIDHLVMPESAKTTDMYKGTIWE